MKIAVIPARAGSKRIPRKNIRPFAGKPIIAYSIEVAHSVGLFDKIVVSTDDEEIAEVARKFGAETPFMRPPELADDFAGTNLVVKHAIDWFIERGFPVDYACCIYATAPFIKDKYLDEGFEKLVSSGKSFAFSITSFPFPVQRALRINRSGEIEAAYPEYSMTRSQDLEEMYHDAAQFYWGRAEAFMEDISTYSTASVPIVLPRCLVQDIDTPEDWEIAELMLRAQQLMELED